MSRRDTFYTEEQTCALQLARVWWAGADFLRYFVSELLWWLKSYLAKAFPHMRG